MAETLCGKKVHCTAFDPFHLLGRYLREERALMQYGTEYSSIYEADRHEKAKRSEARPGERGEGQYLLRQSTCCNYTRLPPLLTAMSIRPFVCLVLSCFPVIDSRIPGKSVLGKMGDFRLVVCTPSCEALELTNS